MRRKPIGELTTEDLRVLIGQQEGLEVLVPQALSQLAENPFAEGDCYPGDLLATVLRVPTEYWSTHPDLLTQIIEIITVTEQADPDHGLFIDAPFKEIRSLRDRMHLKP